MTRHSWTLTAAAPPSAWAALVADAKALIAVARARGITVAGPIGSGQPVLDSERIALTVRTPGKPFSAPFVFSRTLPGGELDTVDSGLFDSIVLSALSRAGRHFGALLTVSSAAPMQTVAQATRLADLVFGADDRRIAGTPEPGARRQVEDLVASLLDVIEDEPAGEGPAVVDWLTSLIDRLTAERDGRAAAEEPVP